MKTVSIKQVLISLFVPVLLLGLNYLIPTGPIHDWLAGVIAMLGGIGVVSTRIPSTQGGTVIPAVTIAPVQPIGTALIAAPPVK
jgi:hypothetical protein